MGAGPGARPSDDWIERVRAASDVVEVISQSVSLRKAGRNWVGLCPFHQEKTPSFSVHPERQFYHCFSCKAGGDVFKFVQETEKLSFVEAAELLSHRAGIPVPERRGGERGLRRPLLDALEAATQAYEQWLSDPERGVKVQGYLRGRGLERDTVRTFRLGFALPGWENLVGRLADRFGGEVLVQAGLAVRREGTRGGWYDRFRHRLMVPLIAPGGEVVGFGARALEAQDDPKYLNSPETAVYHKGSFLYAFEQARRHRDAAGEMIVVEGYFDAIAMHQAGIKNTVATSGTALTAEQARLLGRVVARVALTYDGDAAGQEAMMRSLAVLMSEGLEVVVVDLPRGEDPDSVVRGGGAEAWHAARRAASDPIQFIQRHGLRRATTGAGAPGASDPREAALQAVVELAVKVVDPIRSSLLLERAGQVFGLSETVLIRAVELKRAGQHSLPPLAAAVRESRRSEGHLERELLQALLQAPEGLAEARRQLSPEDFHDPSAAALARTLWSGEDAAWANEVGAGLARELTAAAPEVWDWARVAEACTRRLVRRRLERRYREAQQRILELQRQGLATDPETRQLLQEAQELARDISGLNR